MNVRAARRPQRPLLILLVLAGLLFLVALLPRWGRGGALVPAEGGILVEDIAGPVTRIDPLDASARPGERDVARLVFDGLTRPGPDGAPLPALAESWSTNDDASVFVFRLRNGLLWQD